MKEAFCQGTYQKNISYSNLEAEVEGIPVVLDALPLQVPERPEAKGFIDHHVQVRECLDRCRPLLMFYVTYLSYYMYE